MHQGNWKCSGCGGAITELPFQPRSENGLTCRVCYAKKSGRSAPTAAPESTSAPEAPDDMPFDAGVAGEIEPFEGMDDAVPVVAGDKPRFSGDWACAGCGSAITSLPFQPRDTSNLKCIECFKQSKS